MTAETRIGFIGIGAMGSRMAANLARALWRRAQLRSLRERLERELAELTPESMHFKAIQSWK